MLIVNKNGKEVHIMAIYYGDKKIVGDGLKGKPQIPESDWSLIASCVSGTSWNSALQKKTGTLDAGWYAVELHGGKGGRGGNSFNFDGSIHTLGYLGGSGGYMKVIFAVPTSCNYMLGSGNNGEDGTNAPSGSAMRENGNIGGHGALGLYDDTGIYIPKLTVPFGSPYEGFEEEVINDAMNSCICQTSPYTFSGGDVYGLCIGAVGGSAAYPGKLQQGGNGQIYSSGMCGGCAFGYGGGNGGSMCYDGLRASIYSDKLQFADVGGGGGAGGGYGISKSYHNSNISFANGHGAWGAAGQGGKGGCRAGGGGGGGTASILSIPEMDIFWYAGGGGGGAGGGIVGKNTSNVYMDRFHGGEGYDGHASVDCRSVSSASSGTAKLWKIG